MPVSSGLTTTTRSTYDSRIRATSQQLPVTSNATRSDGIRLSANPRRFLTGLLGSSADEVNRARRIRGGIALTALVWAGAGATAQAEDVVVSSFDGTPIVAHWFPNPSLAPGEKAPVVLNGPGWSSPGEQNPAQGAIKRLHDLGYNVVTWDPRGFGVSGGEVNIDAPQVEGRDVKALIDLMARQPEVRLDERGDPRVGMTGGSYGGGIQLSTAGIDRRIDAIVPVVGWHSLESSLYKDRSYKEGWNTLLYSIGLGRALNDGLAGGPAGVQTGGLDPHITSAYNSASSTGVLSAEDERWFRGRGPGDATIRRITAPTLVVGGTVDTLFPLDEDVKIYRLLKDRGVPVKMFWFCGGHGQCAEGNGGEPGAGLDVGSILGSGGGDDRLLDASAAWLARYLKGDRSVRTGAEFEFKSDDGRYRTAPGYPVAPAKPLLARGSGSLSIAPGATSGGAMAASPVGSGALEVPLTVRRRGHILGPPKVTIKYSGTGAPADAHVFAQLVKVGSGVAVGNQATPIPVDLDGRRHTITRRLVPITSAARAGERYVLQLVAGTKVWAAQRASGTLNASRVELELPVAHRRAFGPRGVPCSPDHSVAVRPSGRRLRRQVVSGRLMLGGKRVGRIRRGGRGGRVRFRADALGEQRLRLVLRLANGRTVVQKRTLVLCGAG
jgi:ABC-2 type transport system ATP-binding protein